MEWLVITAAGLGAVYWVEDKLSGIADSLRRTERLLEKLQADRQGREE